MSTDVEKNAIERLCNSCYHRSLWLPATQRHGRLRVTYATSRNFDNESLPVMLFVPPQFSTRWLIIAMDHFAEVAGVRLIGADRPGFGGSDAVQLDLRVEVWLETVPVLLQRLNIQHVSLFCHSAGSIFLLNTLHKLRDILDPRAPIAILIAPWVPTTASHTTCSTLLANLPASVLRRQHGLISFVNKMAPSFQWSSAMSSNMIKLSNPFTSPGEEDPSMEMERYNCDRATAKLISKLYSDYMWAEETKGINDEALTCVRKSSQGSWGACEDFAECARDLAQHERELAPENKLNIKAFFAESDFLVGVGGQKYLEDCFAQTAVKEVIDFESSVRKGTGHDSIMTDHHLGAVVDAFGYVASALSKGI